jgi:CRISPR/Cas system CSM-associated protein Csm4 (group 5 of RAMP superfamily)
MHHLAVLISNFPPTVTNLRYIILLTVILPVEDLLLLSRRCSWRFWSIFGYASSHYLPWIRICIPRIFTEF